MKNANVTFEQDFIDELNAELNIRNANFTVELQKANKPHGEEYGIRINTPYNISPVVYPTSADMTPDNIDHIVNRLIDTYKQQLGQMKNFNINKYIDKDYICDNVKIRLTSNINADSMKNSNIHFDTWNDLLVMYYIEVTTPDGSTGTITLTNDVLTNVGIDADTLRSKAYAHNENPIYFKNIIAVLNAMLDSEDMDAEITKIEDAGGPRMYVASNESRQFGASVILTEDFKNKIQSTFGNKAVIIPSSIHELIVVDYGNDDQTSEFTNMITDVNDTQLEDRDVLACHPYFYFNGEIYDHNPDETDLQASCQTMAEDDACLELFEH